MIQLVLSFLMAVGVVGEPPQASTDEVSERVREEHRPTEDEMECYISCFHLCLWHENPAEGPELPW